MVSSPISKSSSKSRKLRIGPSLFVVIVGIQLVFGFVWHFFGQASLPPRQDAQSLIPPNNDQVKRQRVARNDGHVEYTIKNVSTEQQQVVVPVPVAAAQAQDNQTHTLAATTNSSSTQTKLWHRSSTLPLWIQEYFDWAVEQQRHLNEDNWESQRYLVMQCLKSDAHCGGTSDRLKPIPIMLLLAMRSKRLFYIRWTRPCSLEEFLVPQENGYNWTMPDWLVTHFESVGARTRVNAKMVIADANKTMPFLHARLQTFDGGSDYFNEQFNGTTGVTYETIYHDLFRILFTPSPPIQQILDSELKAAGLKPGEYATAHYRAFYGHRKPNNAQIAEASINAVECASELRPGGPVYFAADSAVAIQTIKNYAHNYSRPVVIIENDEPLHLDKANSTTPADYYSVFVDLFLLGMGRCGSVGMGGFGRYGLLLSYNATCWNRHLYNRQRMDCHWKDAPATDVLQVADQ